MSVAFDDLWDYHDPAQTEVRLRAARPAPENAALTVEWLTQLARTQGLQRRFDEAHALLDEAAALEASRESVPRARLLLERGRAFNSGGDRDRARERFIEAWRVARSAHGAAAAFHAVDAAHMVAIASEGDDVLAWNERGLEAAEASDDPLVRRWIGSLCNNIGWTHHGAGDAERALRYFERALQARLAHGRPSDVPVAQWCVARCLRTLGRADEALAMQTQLHAGGSSDGYVDEEMGECLLALGRAEEATAHFARAHERLSQDAWLRENESERLERLARLGAAR